MGRNKAIIFILSGAFIFGFAARRAPQASVNASFAPQSASPVHFTAGGNAAEIPAKFVGNLVFLPVRVNDGKPSLFELDSTAQASSIDSGRAAEVSLSADNSAPGTNGATAQAIRNVLIALPGVDVLPSELIEADLHKHS